MKKIDLDYEKVYLKNTAKINNIKKIVLVYPNQRWFKEDMHTSWNLNPSTLCILAAMIKDHVEEIKIIDAQFDNLTQEQFKEEIIKINPDLVGISVLTTEYSMIGDITLDIIKEFNSEIITVLGGVHSTLHYEDVMKNKKVDFCIRGEGEYVFQGLIKFLNSKGSLPSEGLIHRSSEDNVVIQEATLVKDVDKVAIPDYSFIDFEKYTMTSPREGIEAPPALPFARVQTSRGCPIGCTFCLVESISGKKLRKRSAESIIEELEYLVNTYNIKSVVFEDDNPFADKVRTKRILRAMIDKKLNLKWKATAVFLPAMDEEIFDLMAQSGCIMLNVAIESGNQRVLNEVIQKPLKLDTVAKKVELAHKYGLFVVANFIVGLPSETWEEMRETFRFAEETKIDYVKFFIANVFSGTKLYDYAMAHSAIDSETYSELNINWRFSRIKSDHWDAEEVSILRAYEWDRINFTCPKKREKTAKMMNISLEELDVIRRNTRKVLHKDLYPVMNA